MAGSTNSREQNFWPGFVDALTNVVLVMVFIVVVFSLSLFYFMTKITKAQIASHVQELEQKQEAQNHAGAAQAAAQIAALQQKLAESASENVQLLKALRNAGAAPEIEGQPAAPKRSPEKLPPVAISGSGDRIVVYFGDGVTSMEKKLRDALDSAIGSYAGASTWRVQFEADSAEASPSEARRLGFYRIAMLRDHLVSKGVSPARVSNVVRERDGSTSAPARSHVTITLRRS